MTHLRLHSACLPRLAAFVLLGWLTGIASAQDDRGGRRMGGRGFFGGGGAMPGGGGGGMDIGMLLRSDAVQKELDLMPDQSAAIEKLWQQGRDRNRERPDFRSMSDEERREAMKKMMAERTKQLRELRERLDEVLFPEQSERLDQIVLQTRGIGALTDPEVAGKLGITDEQKDRLAKLREEMGDRMRKEFREMMQGGPGGFDRDAIRKKVTEMREQMESESLDVLTPDQKQQFEAMKGEEFDLPTPQWRRDRGRRGRRGGGRPDTE